MINISSIINGHYQKYGLSTEEVCIFNDMFDIFYESGDLFNSIKNNFK